MDKEQIHAATSAQSAHDMFVASMIDQGKIKLRLGCAFEATGLMAASEKYLWEQHGRTLLLAKPKSNV